MGFDLRFDLWRFKTLQFERYDSGEFAKGVFNGFEWRIYA